MFLTHRKLLLVATFLLSLVIYRVSPVPQVYDSEYSMLLSEILYKQHTFDLAGGLPPWYSLPATELPYKLRRAGAHLYYLYPPGTSILCIPLVAALNAVGVSAMGPDGYYDLKGEVEIQRWIAALLCAGTVTILLSISLQLTSPPRALVLAVVTALGTSLWSTGSRAMWSQTTQVFLLAASLMLLVCERPKNLVMRSMILGTLLGWMYATRPTSAVSIAGILVYLLLRNRRQFLLTALVGMLWLIAFTVWSQSLYHTWQPWYYSSRLSFETFLTAAAGQVVSPSRGLLIFSPWLLAIPVVLVRFRHGLREKPIMFIAIGVVGAHWIVISAWQMWWFGHCFGPRAFLDVVPWLALLGALALGAVPSPAAIGRATLVFMAVLALISVGIHAQGALSRKSAMWNVSPANVDMHPERIWDWSAPQCVAGCLSMSKPVPAEVPRIDAPQRLR